ncbi:hypothetical protein CGLO_10508 [Colletotrichum gloeosporioides Cg-14]|uniref:Uncharacterized protein n=1 Tax=Colletotrichum gloeosporioides (strain Cg-14) TaxID=1237896 RepID=T0LPG8_COLGC|nr:hypothetical protein CGLO_10508 [Colletotrichum gloeosporioides Cg-14]
MAAAKSLVIPVVIVISGCLFPEFSATTSDEINCTNI